MVLPIAIKIDSQTIAGNYVEPEERIIRRDRVLKLKRILGKKFNKIVSDEEFNEIMEEKKTEYKDGLVAVKPMSTASSTLLYMDYKYSGFTSLCLP